MTSEDPQHSLLSFNEALDAYFRDSSGLDADRQTFVRRILDKCLEQIETASVALDNETSLDFYSLKFNGDEQEELWLNRGFVLDCIHVYDRYLEAHRTLDEAVSFVDRVWSTFLLSTLALKLYWQTSTDRKNCDNALSLISALRNLSLFPQAQVFKATIDGNHDICFNNDDHWDWPLCDEIISLFIASGVRSNLISLSLLRYRIGTETWAYHRECMNAFSGLARGASLATDYGGKLFFTDDYKRAIDLNYSRRAISSAHLKRVFTRSAVAEVGVLGIGAGLLYAGSSNNLGWMTALGAIFCAYIFSINIIGPLRWLGLLPTASLKAQKSPSLSLLGKMTMLTRDVSESSVDLAETITKIRSVRNEGAAFPAVLVALLHHSVTPNTVHFDDWNVRD